MVLNKLRMQPKKSLSETNKKIIKYLLKFIPILILFWALWGIKFNLFDLINGIPNAFDFIGRMLPPDFKEYKLYISSAFETIQIAIIGTFFASLVAFPLSFLAARNVNSNFWLYNLIRLIFDICRGISEIIWGLIFVSIVGLGPSAGVLALAVHNFGALGRYFSETVENIPKMILDAPVSAGATKAQTIACVIFPEVRLKFLGYLFYYFEHSLRAATVLGLVGAGGIGFLLETRISLFRYKEASAILIILLIVVVGFDRVSAIIRRNALHLQSSIQ